MCCTGCFVMLRGPGPMGASVTCTQKRAHCSPLFPIVPITNPQPSMVIGASSRLRWQLTRADEEGIADPPCMAYPTRHPVALNVWTCCEDAHRRIMHIWRAGMHLVAGCMTFGKSHPRTDSASTDPSSYSVSSGHPHSFTLILKP